MQRRLLAAVLLLVAYALLTVYLELGLGVSRQEGYVESGGAFLRYAEWRPASAPRGVAVLYHGFGGSSEMMGWLGVELARNGFHVLAFDSRGHGKSSSSFNITASTLLSDLDALLTAANLKGEPLVLVGHSMGGAAVQTIASRGVPVEALVVIASRPAAEAPANRSLLVLAGLDEIFPPSAIQQQSLRGWDLLVLPLDDHLSVLYSPAAVNGILEWLLGSYASLVGERLLATIARSATALLLMVVVSSLLAAGGPGGTFKASFKRCVLLAVLLAPLAFPAYLLLSRAVPAPVAVYILSVLYTQAAGAAIASRKSLGELTGSSLLMTPRVAASSLAMSAAAYLLLHEALQPFFNVEPSLYRAPLTLLLFLLAFPQAFAFEAFARPSLTGGFAARLAKSIALRAAGFLAAWAAAAIALGPAGFSGYLLVVTMVSLLLLVPIDAAATSWAARGSPLGNALWTSLTVSLLISAVTPIL
ncbi:MAG: alpha/beta hydrolase [Thermofilum sp.]